MEHLLPMGVNDFLPVEAEQYRNILKKIAKVLSKNSYVKIKTPTIEYYESLAEGLTPQLKERALRFFDHAGELLILRPDHTTPVARLVSTRMAKEAAPLRLYYMDPIFRKPKNYGVEDLEIFQAGIELIGVSGPEAEAEVIKIALECFKELGLKEFGADIGHVDFAGGLSNEKRAALLAGVYTELGAIPEIGGPNLVANHPGLVKTYQILKQAKLDQYLKFNKGLVKDLDYYTGGIFEFYVKGVRSIIGSGGRYDNLLRKFGPSRPAVGFALNLKSIQEALHG